MLTSIIGCDSNNESATFDMEAVELGAVAEDQSSVDETLRKLIKEGRVEFETENIDSTRKTTFRIVGLYQGYISSDQEYKSSGRTSNTLTIRVPAKNFDRLLSEATSGVDKFDSKEITMLDVTEEYLDIQARLNTKKELETRYLELLKQANTVTEILEIEKQAGELRSEIESIEGRLKYLENQVSFSTLTMTFYQRTSIETAFGQKFSDGFKNGWDNLVWFFVLLTNIWPFIILGVGLIIGIRVMRKNK